MSEKILINYGQSVQADVYAQLLQTEWPHNLFTSMFILKFPTPPVQEEKKDFPQRQQWTVSDSTFLGKEKEINHSVSFLFTISTAVIFG